MCISASASIKAFIVNFLSAISLVYFGNENLKSVNLIIALFSIYTSFMQLVDLGIWLDLDCKKGLNKTASLIGPTLTYLQPIVIFVIAYLVLNYTKAGIKKRKSQIEPFEKQSPLFEMFSISSKKLNTGKIINIIAAIIIIFLLVRYYTSDEDISCSKLSSNNNISWGWLKTNKMYYIPFCIIYTIVTFSNILLIDPLSNFIKLVLVLYLGLFTVAHFIKKSHRGELWCFTSNILPLLLLVIQKLFKNQFIR